MSAPMTCLRCGKDYVKYGGETDADCRCIYPVCSTDGEHAIPTHAFGGRTMAGVRDMEYRTAVIGVAAERAEARP